MYLEALWVVSKIDPTKKIQKCEIYAFLGILDSNGCESKIFLPKIN